MSNVTILLALHDAGAHLMPQLESISAQSHADWRLIISDDGASDGSREVALAFAARHAPGRVQVVDGPRQGFAANFLSMLAACGDETQLVALADHDDVWLPEKLARAVAALAPASAQPRLYCARTIICDDDLQPLSEAPIWPRPYSFANALVQNVAAGNTIVLDRAGLTLAQAALEAAMAAPIKAHDWWLYQLITGASGTVLRDHEPVLLYRQHAGNEMGRNDTLGAIWARLGRIFAGDFRDWNDRNIRALRGAAGLLTPQARGQLEGFAQSRSRGLPARITGLRRVGIYRQTRGAGVAMWLAALLGRL